MTRRQFGLLPYRGSADHRFLMSDALSKLDIPDVDRTRLYSPGPDVDQGQTPKCVGFSGENWLLSAPVMDKMSVTPGGDQMYAWCKEVDGFPNEDGSTTDALMHVLRDRMGVVDSWVNCYDELTLRRWIQYVGTAFIGFPWFTGMMETDKYGFIRPTGQLEGYHENVVIGYSLERDAYRGKNCWGSAWGDSGNWWMMRADMNTLMSRKDSDATGALEKKVLRAPHA